jgi:hypothetical protein
MSKAYLTGTVKKMFDLQRGTSAKTGKDWTRLDVVVTKTDGEEQILKVWDGDQLQVYEGATIEAHGKLDEYKGEVRVVANAKDVTVNGNAPATPEVAKTVLSGQASVSTGQGTIPFTRLMELHAEWGPKLARSYSDAFSDMGKMEVVAAAGITAASSSMNTALIALTKQAKVVDDDGDEDGQVPF